MSKTSPRKIAVIGDRFMLSSMFEEALRERCKLTSIAISTHDLPWPDEPMEHGYAIAGMDGLKEYMGSADLVVAQTGDAEVLVTHLAPLSASIMDRLPNLKLVAVSRGGPVNIDMKAARDRGITVVNTPGRNASAVAEFTIGAILAETRNITRGHDGLRKGEYRGELYRADVTGRELSEMTVGLVGYGEVGRRVVKYLKAFGCRILVSDPYVQLSAEDLNDGVIQCSFERVLEEADVLSLHPARHPGNHAHDERRNPPPHEERCDPRQHGPRPPHGLRRVVRGDERRPPARCHAGNIFGGARARGFTPVAIAQCDTDAPHCRCIGEDSALCGGAGSRGSAPLLCW
jgi:hypothetical protein